MPSILSKNVMMLTVIIKNVFLNPKKFGHTGGGPKLALKQNVYLFSEKRLTKARCSGIGTGAEMQQG